MIEVHTPKSAQAGPTDLTTRAEPACDCSLRSHKTDEEGSMEGHGSAIDGK